MTILFLIALLLAIPTTGLSLLVWVVVFFLAARNKAKNKISGLDHMRSTRAVVEPMIGGTRAQFYNAIAVPKLYGSSIRSREEDERCGQHILNFISHNPGLPEAFMDALKFHRFKGSASMPTAIEALENESQSDRRGPIHHLCFFAISTLMLQNKLTCFDDVNMNDLIAQTHEISREYPGMTGYAS